MSVGPTDPTTPTPDPTPAPTPAPGPQTIGDLIAAAGASDDAVGALSSQLDTARTTQGQAHAALAQALAAAGRSVVHVNPDGSATIYVSDGAGGYHPTAALMDTSPIPTAPTPAPTPAPGGP